jgi:hypothetical protein
MSINMTKIALSALALSMSGTALGSCPPLTAYRVQGVSAKNATPAEAIGLLLAGTPWKADVDAGLNAPINLRSVSGPLDRVLERLIDGLDSSGQITMLQDSSGCVVRVALRQPPAPVPAAPAEPAAAAAAPTPLPDVPLDPAGAMAERVIEVDPFADTTGLGNESAPAPRSHVLPAGKSLSEALEEYVADRGWTIRWMLEEDYILDVDVPVPPLDVIDGVTWVVTAYQQQGGLRGVTPRFATPNKVVVIEAMNIREDVR